MISKKLWRSRLLAAMLVMVMLLSGCLPKPLRPEEQPSESSQSIEPNYEVHHEQALKEQERFDSIMYDLFVDQVASSQILLHFSLKNPETYGVAECHSLFDDYTLASQKESMQENKDMLNQLSSFDVSHLTGEQTKTYFILQNYLKTELLSDGLELYSEPLSTTIGVQAQLPILLCEYAFDDKQDVEDYLLLLASLDDYYGQLLGFYRQKADAGLMPSDRTIDHIIESCESYILVPEDNFMIETFQTRLETVPNLTDEEKNEYQTRNSQLLESSFVPAYQNLVDGMTKLKGTGKNDQGLCYYPDGKRYYEYMVKSATGTSYNSIAELMEAMEKQLSNDIMTVAALANENPELINQIGNYSFQLSDPVEILEDLKVQIQKDFPELPDCNYTINYVPEALERTLSPAFYLTPPLDDFMNNPIYINRRSVPVGEGTSNLYTVLAHEGYPGHLYQNVYFNATKSAEIRYLLSFEGYSEGWASYVERYCYSLDNGLDPQLGQLLAANTYASLGLQAILDVYINYYGWDIEKVKDFLSEFYLDPNMEVVQSIFDAMVENPANYLSYYVGFLEFESMRQEAQEALGQNFSLTEFHRLILDIGPAPFFVLRSYMASWMLTQKI